MKNVYTIDAEDTIGYYEITVRVTTYHSAKSAYISGAPEDCYPAEDAEIEFDVEQIIAYYEDMKPVTTKGENLDFPESLNFESFKESLIILHEKALRDDLDDEDRQMRRWRFSR